MPSKLTRGWRASAQGKITVKVAENRSAPICGINPLIFKKLCSAPGKWDKWGIALNTKTTPII
jgi:hypothetical protein